MVRTAPRPQAADDYAIRDSENDFGHGLLASKVARTRITLYGFIQRSLHTSSERFPVHTCKEFPCEGAWSAVLMTRAAKLRWRAIQDFPLEDAHEQVGALFKLYGPVFVDLANGHRADRDALLAFYAAPLRVVADGFDLLLADNEALLGEHGLGSELARFRKEGFTASVLAQFNITNLNRRSVFVNASWRRSGVGVEDASFDVTYLVIKTDVGWRITNVMEAST